MERKNYLIEKLSKEERGYLKKIAISTRRKYIRDNYNNINTKNVHLDDCINMEAESVLDIVLNKCEREIESAVEFEKIISDEKLYHIVKVLSLEEKMVLFALYKENKDMTQIASEMNLGRTTIWRIKNNALNEIINKLLGGNKNV